MSTVSTGAPEVAAIGANDQDLVPGQEVGEYRIERQIGRGGFGRVYAAVHPLIGKQVAIKVLARKFSADPDIVSRFVAEARAVNQIRHRNIIDIFSFGSLPDGRHYYVMEYLDGQPLDAYLRDHGPMSLDEALPVLRAVARALDAAHAKGIAHRDLKPENIFLARDPDGAAFPKLLDFGIAKLLAPEDDVRHKTGTGVPLGTPYYMSPEQCRGREVDHRTDIYSFGIVAYRLLTGTFPFEGEDFMELLFKQTNDEPPPPSSRNPELPPSVDAAIAWMMRKDRTQRPPSVVEAVRALDPGQSVTPSSIPPLRGSASSVAPKAASALALENTSNPDALAATFTPEFARPSLELTAPPTEAATTPNKSRVPLWIAIAGVVIAGGAVAFALLVNRDDTSSSAASSPSITTTTISAPPPPPPAGSAGSATINSVGSAEPPPAVVPEPAPAPVVETKRKQPVRRPKQDGKTQQPATTTTAPKEPVDTSRSTIPSDTIFK